MNTSRSTRRTQAALLTAFTLLTIAILGSTLGLAAALLAALTMPVPLALLWLSSDVYRADELRDAGARAVRRKPTAAPSPRHVRA